MNNNYTEVYPWSNELTILYPNFIKLTNESFCAPFWKGDTRSHNRFVVELTSDDNIYNICKYIYERDNILPCRILINGISYIELSSDELYKPVEYILDLINNKDN